MPYLCVKLWPMASFRVWHLRPRTKLCGRYDPKTENFIVTMVLRCLVLSSPLLRWRLIITCDLNAQCCLMIWQVQCVRIYSNFAQRWTYLTLHWTSGVSCMGHVLVEQYCVHNTPARRVCVWGPNYKFYVLKWILCIKID